MQCAPGLTGEDVLLAVTTLSFDIAGLELYLPLITGAKVVLASRETAADGEALLRLLDRQGVTVLQATPSTWRLMLAAGWKRSPRLKALCGGEALPADIAAEILPRCAELWNMYGPTETTIWSTCAQVSNAQDVHIGRPIDNTEIYILDSHQQPLPVGVAGELLIGGTGLARGYLNRSELTAEKFVPHPFKPGQRLYRTGDLARYRSDGNIDCLGRLDFQVKVRGFRIELGEIEAELAQHSAIRESVVVAREDTPGDKRLVAYLVPRSPQSQPQAGELRELLRRKLADYMVPSAFVFLEALPVLPNGKINRKALPAPDAGSAAPGKGAVLPRNPAEQKLVQIFEKVLNARVSSVDDNFFDLGGHSILAVRLMAAIEQEFGTRLPLATLFQHPTVEGIATAIRDAAGHPVEARWSPLVRIQPQGSRPPIFLVHGAGGNVLLYRDLARCLGGDQPLYGLQSVGLDGQTAPLASVEDMARAYLPHLRRIQPSGPYFLGGYCMGGLVAYEMARYLVKDGEEVALLAMLDTYNLSTITTAEGESGSQLFQRLKFHLGNLGRLRPGEIGGYLKEKVRIAKDGELANILGGVFGSSHEPGSGANATPGRETVQEANDRAATLYRPPPYSGRITVFKPEVNYAALPDQQMGWGGLAEGGADIVALPVNPHAMLVEPFVQYLAEEFRSRLSREPAHPKPSANGQARPMRTK
jgi:thioesterase domain-containing protein/acyl carrier protein